MVIASPRKSSRRWLISGGLIALLFFVVMTGCLITCATRDRVSVGQGLYCYWPDRDNVVLIDSAGFVVVDENVVLVGSKGSAVIGRTALPRDVGYHSTGVPGYFIVQGNQILLGLSESEFLAKLNLISVGDTALDAPCRCSLLPAW